MSQNNTPTTPTQKTPKLYVRFSSAKMDTQKVLDFYETHKHKNVRKREEKLLKKMVELGAVTIVEDEQGTIVASSISYPCRVNENGKDICKWSEVGSTRIVANGYPGLFDVMSTAQVLRAYLAEPPEDCFVGHMEHASIQKIALRLGWKEYDKIPDGLAEASNVTVESDELTKRSPNDWYYCDIKGVQVMAQYLVKIMENPILTHLKTKHQYEISLERSELLNIFWPNIENLAKKDFNDPSNKVDATRGIKETRDRWLYKLR